MGIHLYKQGLRKCYICKDIFPLDNFYKSSKQARGVSYKCKSCALAGLRRYREAVNTKTHRREVIDYLKRECNKCGIKHDNYSFFDVDHIIAIRQGRGRRRYKMSEVSNYMVLCPNCHRLKTIAEDGFK